MARHGSGKKGARLAAGVGDLRLKTETPSDAGTPGVDERNSPASSNGNRLAGLKNTATTASTSSQSATPQSPAIKSDMEETIGGEITVKMEPGAAPKLSRSHSKKLPLRPARLFSDEPDAGPEALKSFERINNCLYSNKWIGTTDHALECDCTEEWDSETSTNHACGEDSDCINRATKMECVSDCSCGDACQNRRFQRKEYADVTVFKTDKKGYGLRADYDLEPNRLIFEYIGEVIGEAQFERRLEQYDREKIKHFYFMSLNKGEFVDATKKGNLGRFCNHSCNPNCYVDKWVVGDRLRMGIFSERAIVAGEELTFNYNVDRYGAEPQACYCGEPNCTGYLGGKTQTERGTKLPAGTIEALGLEDGDDWDLAVAKRPKKKKTGEYDEEYIDRVEPRSLDEGAVNKVMATLMQCKEQWIAVKLLKRIQKTEEDRIKNRVVRMHGYRIFKQVLATFSEDNNIILQVLDVLRALPRITRNKIQDSGIEESIRALKEHGDEKIGGEAEALLKVWEALEVGYRIPRMKPGEGGDRLFRDDRRQERQDSRTRKRSVSKSPPRGPSNVPSGPRHGASQRPTGFAMRPSVRPGGRLPPGWFGARDAQGKVYYYNNSGQTTWTRPSLPATASAATSKQAPKAVPTKAKPAKEEKTTAQVYQEIINSITSGATDPRSKPSSSSTPKSAAEPSPKVSKEPKWKALPEDKQMKIYENTIHPHIKHVTDKYHHKIPKEDIKKHARELCKKFVASDYKKGRVADPTTISKHQERVIKDYVRDYFDKLLTKHRARAERKLQPGSFANGGGSTHAESTTPIGSPTGVAEATVADSPMTPAVGSGKRKLEDDDQYEASVSPGAFKRVKSDDGNDGMLTPPPPPPPPPPADSNGHDPNSNTNSPMELDHDAGDSAELAARGNLSVEPESAQT